VVRWRAGESARLGEAGDRLADLGAREIHHGQRALPRLDHEEPLIGIVDAEVGDGAFDLAEGNAADLGERGGPGLPGPGQACKDQSGPSKSESERGSPQEADHARTFWFCSPRPATETRIVSPAFR